MFRKLLFSIICTLLIISQLQMMPKPASAETKKAVIAADGLNIRSGPGLSYSVIASVKKGAVYSITDQKNDWYQIQLSGNNKGWVASWLVTLQQSSEAPKTSSGSTSDKVKSTAEDLRIRSGPGTSFQVTGTFDKGQTASFVQQNSNWVEISYKGKRGWVSSQFVIFLKKEQSKAPASSGATSGKVIATSLNVRNKPSTSADTIGSLKKNASVSITKTQDKWHEIQFKGQKGWVHSDFISTGSVQSPVGSTKKGKVTASSLNVRSVGSLNGSVVGSILKNAEVMILESKNSWHHIQYSGNKKGWVSSSFISIVNGQGNTGNEKPSQSKVSILQDGTNIRKGPATNQSILRRANAGEQFSVISKEGDWFKIQLSGNTSGYVAGWVVSQSGEGSSVTRPGGDVTSYLKNKTVVLDPGHGGRDGGAIGTRGTLEKNLTMSTAKLVFDKLKASGADVHLTRSSDSYISLSSRVSTSHYRNADAFISFHFDSIDNRSVNGMTTYYYSGSKDKPLASPVHSELMRQTKLKDRGTKFGDYHVIRENNQPAILLELGYVSNSTEEMTVRSSTYQERVAQGVYYGLAQYFK
ncbi:SH3 domain-containing protein [Metabacillus hrfriensis]|uniref:SH3 domain-containing protein n=1 Tax=Metabacillus hrfriensis TaxID=3048891 RepID=A0ACD4R941_9BACI|nr:SH3 domain-containing protein [Metabacillus sp. CT-WN-B3]WHZ56657.1 SH3 domain-containing protein [Metabacillus sp. CT-WN-B3]